MLGSVAQSISMPRAGANPFIGQVFTHGEGVVGTFPEGTLFAFIEALGRGTTASDSNAGSGGGANDLIMAVVPGSAFEVQISTTTDTVITIAGTEVLRGIASTVATTPGSGKYPGTARTGTGTGIDGGKGGGRLAGPIGVTGQTGNPGLGAGVSGSNRGGAGRVGGAGAGCLTFFRTRDAAVEFANSLYNGAWVVS